MWLPERQQLLGCVSEGYGGFAGTIPQKIQRLRDDLALGQVKAPVQPDVDTRHPRHDGLGEGVKQYFGATVARVHFFQQFLQNRQIDGFRENLYPLGLTGFGRESRELLNPIGTRDTCERLTLCFRRSRASRSCTNQKGNGLA